MKVMEAPEKVYLLFNRPYLVDYAKLNKRRCEEEVEYTRTDAFIEKACNAYCKVCGHYAHSVPTHICRHNCRYFSDFKKYMKGE